MQPDSTEWLQVFNATNAQTFSLAILFCFIQLNNSTVRILFW